MSKFNLLGSNREVEGRKSFTVPGRKPGGCDIPQQFLASSQMQVVEARHSYPCVAPFLVTAVRTEPEREPIRVEVGA